MCGNANVEFFFKDQVFVSDSFVYAKNSSDCRTLTVNAHFLFRIMGEEFSRFQRQFNPHEIGPVQTSNFTCAEPNY